MNLVDTPGTNVILQRQQRLTEEFVPRADLLLFVISADRPLTESEVYELHLALIYIEHLDPYCCCTHEQGAFIKQNHSFSFALAKVSTMEWSVPKTVLVLKILVEVLDLI